MQNDREQREEASTAPCERPADGDSSSLTQVLLCHGAPASAVLHGTGPYAEGVRALLRELAERDDTDDALVERVLRAIVAGAAGQR